ncbi:MAG TPA: hypothetical protein VJ903_00990 [Clostridia bacterium]|nr:hypothetical protein [Clostridia bacterium]
MKKLLIVFLLLVATVTFTACSGSVATPTAAWAGIEVLEYSVQDSSGMNLGTMKTTMRRKSTEGFSNILEDKEYTTADCRMEMQVDTDAYSITTEILAKGMNTVAIKKVFTDKQATENNYTYIAYRDGKRLNYSLNGVVKDNVNVGTSGYTESEFLYMYLRCYPIANVPATIKIFDPLQGVVTEVATTSQTEAEVFGTVPYPGETKSIICNKVTISLSDSPIGKGINVYYTPDETGYNVDSFAESATTSRKFPVTIEENNIKYVLTSMFVA